mmetsp:Transcript_5978/g.14494  ORF Transcript_5978/g.14494 Transcript_5978/m.14494 type:complete len:92 (+) Transcript_5978:1135-1410(+)
MVVRTDEDFRVPHVLRTEIVRPSNSRQVCESVSRMVQEQKLYEISPSPLWGGGGNLVHDDGQVRHSIALLSYQSRFVDARFSMERTKQQQH